MTGQPATEFDFDAVDFVTSDHHFGHVRISQLGDRLFGSVDEMNAVMIERWNAVVGPDDVVLHLGDLALGPIEASVGLTSLLNGRRLLMPGNHDRVSPTTQSNRAVECFLPMYLAAGWSVLPEILEGECRGVPLLASHYPFDGDTTGVKRHSLHRPADTGVPLLHGHTDDRAFGAHGSHEFHVGVDGFGFAPIRFYVIDAWLASWYASLRPGSTSRSTGPLDSATTGRPLPIRSTQSSSPICRLSCSQMRTTSTSWRLLPPW